MPIKKLKAQAKPAADPAAAAAPVVPFTGSFVTPTVAAVNLEVALNAIFDNSVLPAGRPPAVVPAKGRPPAVVPAKIRHPAVVPIRPPAVVPAKGRPPAENRGRSRSVASGSDMRSKSKDTEGKDKTDTVWGSYYDGKGKVLTTLTAGIVAGGSYMEQDSDGDKGSSGKGSSSTDESDVITCPHCFRTFVLVESESESNGSGKGNCASQQRLCYWRRQGRRQGRRYRLVH
jgi:hypothetical protein